VGSRSAMIKDLVSAYPWIEVIEANRKNPIALIMLWQAWRNSDVVLTQYAGKAGGKFALLSKLAACTLAKGGGLIGFSDTSAWNRFLYSTMVPQSTDISPAELERRALKAIGLLVPLPFPTLTHIPTKVLNHFSLESRNYIVVHLFAGAKARGLGVEKNRLLLESLSKAFPNLPLVL